MTESEAGRQPGPGQEWRLWTLSRVDSVWGCRTDTRGQVWGQETDVTGAEFSG